MAFPATHAKRDAIVLQASRGFASAPNSPRVFLQSGHHNNNNYHHNKRNNDVSIQLIRHADKPGCPPVEEMIQRVCSLFPTAREFDVRELLIKYHYREAVVVSALQVLKYPISTPGPAALQQQVGSHSIISNNNSSATPPTRHLANYYVPTSNAWSETMSDGRTSKLGAFSTNSNTPIHSPASQRQNNSPKIKLKYLKSVFPKAEETFLLDLLLGSDNNVNQVTQQLLTLGHQKKDKPQPLTPRRSVLTSPRPSVAPATSIVEAIPKRVPSPDEKLTIKNELQKLFPDEEEPVIELALDSADYELERARIILSSSQEREETYSPIKTVTFSGIKHTMTLSSLKSSPSVISTFKDIASLYSPMKELGPDDEGYRFKPKHHPVETNESAQHRGTDDSLLSKSYITPNGTAHLAKGRNPELLYRKEKSSTSSRVKAQGPNPILRQGPKVTPRASLSSFIANKFKPESMRRI